MCTGKSLPDMSLTIKAKSNKDMDVSGVILYEWY